MHLSCHGTDSCLGCDYFMGQVYNQPAAMLDSQSPFAPAVKAAEKMMLEQLGDLEVSPILLCKHAI